MIEMFNLWEYSKSAHPGTIEATKSEYHGFADGTLDRIGNVELDINEVRLSSGGLPILPLKLFGRLEGACKNRSGKARASIHLVAINGFPIGYMVGKEDAFEFKEGILVPNPRETIALHEGERKTLDSIGALRAGDELAIEYKGERGSVYAHNYTLSPKDEAKYCFSNVCIRDYLRF